MDKNTSYYLDFCRFSAALAVFFYHFSLEIFVEPKVHFPFGHAGVIVFFVISGYVIAWVAETRDHSVEKYLTNRFARLYSVVIPALFLAFTLDYLAGGFNNVDSIYEYQNHTNPILRILSSIFFINQIWNFTIQPFSMGPYWSLPYEFWYYILFASFYYLYGLKRWAAIIFVSLLVGPRILLLFPVWLLGVLAYSVKNKLNWHPLVMNCIFIISISTFFWILLVGNPFSPIVLHLKSHLTDGYLVIFNIKFFIGGNISFLNDYLLGTTFALTIMSANSINFGALKLLAATKYLSRYTFSIYLYHVPLLFFFSTMLAHDPTSRNSQFQLLVLTFSSIFFLGYFTENKKAQYTKFFGKLFHLVLPNELKTDRVLKEVTNKAEQIFR